jgi:dihydrofolate synthase/folylpolyglutamate synthase
MLQESGYRTGLYISPHISDITERIQVDGQQISYRKLNRLAEKYDREVRRAKLSFFEAMTAMAFHYFAEKHVETAVLETGLGGRLDATNIVEQPLATIITDVDYDHCAILGTRLSDIAGEKAGILKKECPVISGAQRPSAAAVIRKRAEELSCPLRCYGKDFDAHTVSVNWSKGSQLIEYISKQGMSRFTIGLLGDHQCKNAALALAAREIIGEQGVVLAEKDGARALANVTWPGRFDVRVLRRGVQQQKVIVDGGHNPGAIASFLAGIKKSPWGKKKHTILFGMLSDKDYRTAIRLLQAVARRVILVPVASPRAADVTELCREWQRYLGEDSISTACSVPEALEAVRDEDVVFVSGSLYLAGEVLKYLPEKNHTDFNKQNTVKER